MERKFITREEAEKLFTPIGACEPGSVFIYKGLPTEVPCAVPIIDDSYQLGMMGLPLPDVMATIVQPSKQISFDEEDYDLGGYSTWLNL